jgi:hypothetical protein
MFAPAAIAVLLAAVTVQGATTCPTPQAVDTHLRPLLAAAPGAAGDVRLERDGNLLHVALYARDGRLTARRTLAGPHSCEALAEAAAVIVAAWQGDGGERPLLAADASAHPASDLRAAAEAPAPLARTPWGVGLGGGLSMAGSSPAATAALTIVNAPLPDRPWLGRLGVVYQGAREAALTTGKLRWQRWTLELGPQLQGGAGNWGWAVHLGGALGLTRLQGVGLADARDQRDLGFGVAGGARLSLGQTGLRPFLELGLTGWPSRLVAYEGGAGRQRTIPRFEGRLTLGGALGR